MNITYIRHSGFIVEDETRVIMIDCCGLVKESEEVKRRESKRIYILASHVHGDHFDPAVLSFGGADTKWILSDDIRAKASRQKDARFLAKGDVYRDDRMTIKAYGSTDEGVSFYIEAGGFKIFHAGDLNNWHWDEEETPGDTARNERMFLDELSLIAKDIPRLDAAMFPVDPRLGKNYAKGAEQFLDAVKVKLFLPMHFWDDYSAANAFGPAAEKRGCRFASVGKAGDTFVI